MDKAKYYKNLKLKTAKDMKGKNTDWPLADDLKNITKTNSVAKGRYY